MKSHKNKKSSVARFLCLKNRPISKVAKESILHIKVTRLEIYYDATQTSKFSQQSQK
jgi:hypothetical protein